MGKRAKAPDKTKKKAAPKDFQKVKNKVGKKKKLPTNATRTEFKARQLVLPRQDNFDDKGDEITSRNLTLSDVLSHVRHHNTQMRREAFQGIKELCASNAGFLERHLPEILDATALSPVDDHNEVRKAFRNLQKWLVHQLTPDALIPFANVIELHVRSALSHVKGEVREDGLNLLELYLAEPSSAAVFSKMNMHNIVSVLCELKVRKGIHTVLAILHQFLTFLRNQSLGTTSGKGCWEAQVSVSEILRGNSADEQANTCVQTDKESGSAIWALVLRTWLLASGTGTDASPDEGVIWQLRVRLHCVALMELALALRPQAGGLDLRPNLVQMRELTKMLRHGEWPLNAFCPPAVNRELHRSLVDSCNIRFAHVLAKLSGSMPSSDIPSKELTFLASSALGFLDEYTNNRLRSLHSKFYGDEEADMPAPSREEIGVLRDEREKVQCILRCLDFLWACIRLGDKSAVSGGPDLTDMIKITSRLANPEGMDTEEERVLSASCLSSTALVASLLGFQLNSLTITIPTSLKEVWPEAVLQLDRAPLDEPGISEVDLQHVCSWICIWPKFVWYLDGRDPIMSHFILLLLVDLARGTNRVGSFKDQVFRKVQPLLMPFLVGLKGGPPPLVSLPPGLEGPQGTAICLLHYFNKLSDSMLKRLCQLVCRWSDIRFMSNEESMDDMDVDSPQKTLGVDCCELLLHIILCYRRDVVTAPMRLQFVLTILLAMRPRQWASVSLAPERSALRLSRVLAACIMDNDDNLTPSSEADPSSQRRVDFETMAWPLCLRLIGASSLLAPRALHFLYCCALAIPDDQPGQCQVVDANSSGRMQLVADMTKKFVQHLGLVTFGAEAKVASEDLLALMPTEARVSASVQTNVGGISDGLGPLPQMLVAVCMKIVAASERPGAYEAIVKICTAELFRLQDLLVANGSAKGISRNDAMNSIANCAAFLSCAIMYRNANDLETSSWGKKGHPIGEGQIALLGAAEVRQRLEKYMSALQDEVPQLVNLQAMMPLL